MTRLAVAAAAGALVALAIAGPQARAAGQAAQAPAQEPGTTGAQPGAQGQPPARPSFRAGVDLVSLNVTVSNRSGQFVTDLDREQFQVFEDGVQQEISFFTRTNLPIALSILLDTSASMDEALGIAQEAAVGFVRRLRPEDLAQVIDFDSRVQIAQGFTSQVQALEQAIRRTTAGGSTSLHNAIYIALRELRKTQPTDSEEIRRQAIVVLSDGEDTSSLVSFEEVLELAKRSETSIYAIGLRPPAERGRGFNEADFVLRQLTQQTGGRVFFPKQASELAAIYRQIGDELSSQYTLGYTSRNPKRDGAWRRLVVRVLTPNATARAKQGYYGPTS